MNQLNQSKRIYFVGIKGVAMAALAVWAKELGKVVAGSDVAEEFPTDEELKKTKIDVHEAFDETHLVAFKPDLVIYTGAHGGRDNPQVVYAKEHSITSFPHGQALGLAMAGKRRISVAGSHGKTTTSAMIATILAEAGLDPSWAIGCGSIRGLGAAGHAGRGDWFIAEADEYVTDPGHDPTPRFLWQKPEVLVVTNIDFDHPDAYRDLAAVQQAFVRFQQNQGGQKLTVINADDPASSVLSHESNVVTFGHSREALYRVRDIRFTPGKTRVMVYKNQTRLGELKLNVAGVHNALNAVAAVAVAGEIGISWEVIKRGLERFGGTKRRLEKLGEIRGALIYDDYAHHPKEIDATIAAVRAWYRNNRLVVIFQPHTYSRTKALLSDFSHALAKADIALITDIYASARETQTDGGLVQQLVDGVKDCMPTAVYAPTVKEVSEELQRKLKTGDVVVFMGAGDIYQWGRKIMNQSDKYYKSNK
ncbi:UDP-N-acetylmuramate--L-alanine ligase [Candidatus Gottesmanbacteria bacterium RIFCSPLOWO2_01_FULL_49_10]|uniref:UDP-N-acetylmuramate--L-alanine ligase n=1 Tax=Candidatus Gottesmanbacteria bacterium RIFCSPLOWO2_01_FULL_49_10 TaxID=1798396 RepID=A0A1F6B0T9_9BACT|nr:MAG: UDP-N-acetylmuramate--L-alanine ligase [Candidatus Gottesmanbacteria bacterium RIFCSPLOWO2_01_FULL_49_10]